MNFKLAKSRFRSFQKAAYRSQQDCHKEICGALLCDSTGNLQLQFIKNLSEQPGRFEIRRKKLLDVSRAVKLDGLKLIGLFHSHPVSGPIPGLNDIKTTPVGFYHLILDVCASE